MKKVIFLSLVFLSLVILIVRFGVTPLTKLLGWQQKAGIKVSSVPQAEVSLNGNKVGSTPFQDETLLPGEYLVDLKTDKSSWQGKVNIKSGTLAVVNREIGEGIASSSGEVLTLTTGKGVVVTSNPSGSTVQVDGEDKGVTPVNLTDISSGEHNFILAHPNFLQRSIRAFVPPNLSLNLAVDLAISEIDLTATTPTPQTANNEVVVQPTPTNFLRVRESASISSAEVGRVTPGDVLTVLDEIPGWFKVRLSDGKEGFVASSYVQKK